MLHCTPPSSILLHQRYTNVFCHAPLYSTLLHLAPPTLHQRILSCSIVLHLTPSCSTNATPTYSVMLHCTPPYSILLHQRYTNVFCHAPLYSTFHHLVPSYSNIPRHSPLYSTLIQYTPFCSIILHLLHHTLTCPIILHCIPHSSVTPRHSPSVHQVMVYHCILCSTLHLWPDLCHLRPHTSWHYDICQFVSTSHFSR